MRKQHGFTVLELLIAIVFLIAIGTIFVVQKRDLRISNNDSQRKTSINALYYNLEDIYYPANHGYPEHLTSDVLKGIDPSILKDPDGVAVGDDKSDFRYEPKDCTDDLCTSYTLRADMEQEADFVKQSRNQ